MLQRLQAGRQDGIPALHALSGRRTMRTAKFRIGQVVRHRIYPFRGVIFDVDPTFSNTEEWWNAIPEDVRPLRDQPFYHLLAENEETEYVAYVSEQNLEPDMTGEPVRHPQVEEIFEEQTDGSYVPRSVEIH
jgi:heat shock protein HspQ